MFKKTYVYGSDPNRTVQLRPCEADAVNKLRLQKVYPDLEDWHPNQRFMTNLTQEEMKHYDRAASILNEDIERRGPVDCELDLDIEPVLRPKK